MNSDESFDNSTYAGQIPLAERELASFIGAVKELFGQEQALLSVADWLDESELMDSPPLSTSRNWRAVTIAASARLANRLAVAQSSRSNRALVQGFVGCSREEFEARRAGWLKPLRQVR